jgi:hypothetical protein
VPYSNPPKWVNGSPPAINADNLNVLSENDRAFNSRLNALEAGGGSGMSEWVFSAADTVQVAPGKFRLYPWGDRTISRWRVSVDTAPTGTGLTVALTKNGVQQATLTIAADRSTAFSTSLDVSLTSSDYVTVDVTQVGSIEPGRDLVVQIA